MEFDEFFESPNTQKNNFLKKFKINYLPKDRVVVLSVDEL